MEFKECKLEDICNIKIGRTPPRKEKQWFNCIDEDSIKWISIKDMGECNKYIKNTTETITLKGVEKFNIPIIEKNTVILSFKLTIGRLAITEEQMISNEAIAQLPIKDNAFLDENYLYYYLKNYDFNNLGNTSSIASAVNSKILRDIIIKYPDYNIQKKIVKVLESIDNKIELNKKINDNLLNIIDKYFDEIFIDIECIKRADEIANITIGKTPPRAKQECFSKDDKDVKWLSISDIGKCGVYVLDTSEKLTKDAINDYNVKIIPENTIVLSFKLTVGRVAITNEKMATNEAIAHFNLNDNKFRSYIYMYLRKFDYNKLGSTSSIATAVNSKIIKAMPIKIPDNNKLDKFNKLADDILKEIKINEIENIKLQKIRDTLLPKLLNGEIDINKVEI